MKEYEDGVSFPMIVGNKKIFVLGDNRNASLDSRSVEVGEIDEKMVSGKVIAILYPFNRVATLG